MPSSQPEPPAVTGGQDDQRTNLREQLRAERERKRKAKADKAKPAHEADKAGQDEPLPPAPPVEPASPPIPATPAVLHAGAGASGRPGESSPDHLDPDPRRLGTQRRIEWTRDAREIRSLLTALQATARKLAHRRDELRQAVTTAGLPADDLRVIVERVAQDTGAPLGWLADEAGVPLD